MVSSPNEKKTVRSWVPGQGAEGMGRSIPNAKNSGATHGQHPCNSGSKIDSAADQPDRFESYMLLGDEVKITEEHETRKYHYRTCEHARATHH